jgi:hypothetical protein
VALAAWITLALPWSRTWLALPLTAALMPLLFFTHQSGAFFGPGWMLLVAYASARKGKRLSAPFVVFVVGGVLLAALLCCHLWVNRLRLGVWTLSNELNEAQIAIHPNPHFSRRMFLEGWLFPLFLLVPAALLGVVALRRRALAAWTLALLLAPSTLFFLWWGLPERGGYITGVAPFYAVAAALALRVPRLPGRAGAIALLALQTAAGYGQVRQWDRGWDPAERAPAVRAALPRGGELISFLELTPVVEAYLGDVNERLGAVLMSEYHIKAEGGPAGFAEVVMKPGLDYALRVGLDVVVDTSYRRLYDLPVVRPRRPYLEAFERLVRERYRVTEIPHPYWSLMRIELASEESR